MINWTSSFSVLHEEIDEQHRSLILIMQKLGNCLISKDLDFTVVLDILTELDEYVRVHFSYEEQLMDKYDYPELLAHRMQHDGLRQKLDNINIFDVEDFGAFANDTLNYLVNW